MSKPAPAPAMGKPSQVGPSRRGCLLIVPLVGGTFLLLIAVSLILFLGLRQVFLEKDGADVGMPLEVVKLTPTVVLTAPASPVPTPGVDCETIISSGDVQVAVSLPVSLTVGGKPFPVAAVVPPPFPPLEGRGAIWVCGTVVNYVVGLEPTPENESLLVGLRPGDEIKLHLSSGTVLFFRFVERRETAANDVSVFEQVRPRLTLVVEREDGDWQIATADYVSETEPVQPPSGTLSQPGQPVRVGDAQVTVISGRAERSGSDLLPGTMYYLVEFSVENVGSMPLDAAGFDMELQDGVGNRYLLSPTASSAGEAGPLSGEIEPHAIVQGTAGYLVPETLAGPTLIWTFAPQPGSELRASVGIPYGAEVEPAPVSQAEVTITDAFLSSNGDVLIIEGEIRNTGTAPLTVELSAISLTSSAGMSGLRSAAPPLPWTIQPGQTQMIELQYEKPAASTALLSLLGYSFEIRGL